MAEVRCEFSTIPINTPCPSCGFTTLFIGTGGHLTCSWIECKNPGVQTTIEALKAEVNRWKANHDNVVNIKRRMSKMYGERCREIRRLDALINTPITDDFIKAIQVEAAHQINRWGEAHDRSKSAENWYWLIGYLAGKALRAHIDGDRDKALHHTISSAAALLNWHKAILDDPTGFGVGSDEDLKALDA